MIEKHLEKLVGFYEIAHFKSFLKAAHLMGVSQPALSKSMQILEDALDTKLFVRHRRGIELTDSGQELFSYCEKLFSELPDLNKKIQKPNQLSGVIRIGTYETLGISFWPKVLKVLRQKLPDIEVQLSTESPHTLWQRLDKGVINCIVDAEPPITERYYSKALYTDKFYLYASPRFIHEKNVDDPLPMAYVRRAIGSNGSSIQENLNQLNIHHKLVFDFDTFVAVKATLLEGLSAGILPNSLAKQELRSGQLVEYSIDGKSISFGSHRICITCLEAHRKEPRIKEIMNILSKLEL